MNVTEAMLLIKSLDHDASLALSTYTRKWYVSAAIGIGDGYLWSGLTEHCGDPATAVAEFLNRLTEVDTNDFDRYIVVEGAGRERREYRWNGAAFADVTGEGKRVAERRLAADRAKASAS